MKKLELKTQRAAAGLATLVLGMLLLTGIGANAQSDQAASPNGLVGTWKVTVQLHVCHSTTTIGAPFQSLLTFGRGGTLIEDTDNAMFYPAFRHPGHGIWSMQDDGSYQASSMAFVTLNGALTATQKIDQTIVIGSDSNHFSAKNAKVKFYDPSGTLVKQGCADAWGERYQ